MSEKFDEQVRRAHEYLAARRGVQVKDTKPLTNGSTMHVSTAEMLAIKRDIMTQVHAAKHELQEQYNDKVGTCFHYSLLRN